jgi:hypothetical protein
LPQYRTPGHRHPPNRKDNDMNGARGANMSDPSPQFQGGGTGMPLANRAVIEERMKTLRSGRARPGRNGDAGRGRGVIPRYAPASRYPGGMSANLAPGCDDAETGPRAVLAMMAAGLAADPPKKARCSDMPGERNAHARARHIRFPDPRTSNGGIGINLSGLGPNSGTVPGRAKRPVTCPGSGDRAPHMTMTSSRRTKGDGRR